MYHTLVLLLLAINSDGEGIQPDHTPPPAGIIPAGSDDLMPDEKVAAEVAKPRSTDNTGHIQEDAVYDRILEFKRRRLRVQPIFHQPFVSPSLRWTEAYSPGSTALWPVPPSERPVSIPHPVTGWTIIKGASEVLSERELAVLAGNLQLQRQIDDARFWRRVAWLGGFGALALGGIASGTYMLQRHEARDVRTIGFSLITVGAASAVAAMFFPTLEQEPVITASQAHEMVDRYNQSLRQELELRPADLVRYGAAH